MPTLPSRFPFLDELTAEGKRRILSLPVRRLEPRTPILSRGDEAGGVFLILDGTLRVYYIGPDGREATLYWIEPGETCILALTATLDGRAPYPAWVETEGQAVDVVIVPPPMFHALFEQETAIRQFVFQALSGRVFELMRTIEEVGIFRLEQRLAALLLRRADEAGVVSLSQERIANHLGTAREVVFRALRSLRSRGLVEASRGSIRIVDRQTLEQTLEGEDWLQGPDD